MRLLSAEIVHGLQPLTIFAQRSILDVRMGSESASDICGHFQAQNS